MFVMELASASTQKFTGAILVDGFPRLDGYMALEMIMADKNNNRIMIIPHNKINVWQVL